MKVRTRIVVGLSLLTVFVFGALLLQSFIISRLREVSIDLKDTMLPATKETRDLIQQLDRLYRAATLLSLQSDLWGDPALPALGTQFTNLTDAQDNVNQRLERMAEFVDQVEKREPTDPCQLRPSLSDVKARWVAYDQLAIEIKESFPSRRPRGELRGLALQVDQGRHNELKAKVEALTRAIDCVVAESVSQSADQAERAVGFSTVLIVAALALSLWAGIWMVRSVTGPLAALTRAHRKWMREDFSHQVDVEPGSKDEFSELARSGNAMAERLGQLDELKKDFLSHLSHELKSPLSAIQSSAQMLLRDSARTLTPRQKRRLELMLENGERLSNNILNLLDYSRLEAGVFSYDFAEQDIVPLLHRYLEGVEPAVLEQGLRLDKQIPAGTPVLLRCDAERLLQVVGNLVDNALKHSPAQSCLTVLLEVRDDLPDSLPLPLDEAFALISVIDRGSGVPEEQQENIFTKFHQVTGSRKGVGLGLAICRKIVEAHQGRIWYEDNPEGGAVFRVLLPMAGEGLSRQDAKTQEEGEGEGSSQSAE